MTQQFDSQIYINIIKNRHSNGSNAILFTQPKVETTQKNPSTDKDKQNVV